MSRLTPHQAQQGFMTIAQNTDDVDYLQLAYVQAMSIKNLMPSSKYAVAVDHTTMQCVTEKHQQVFDFIIEIPRDYAESETWKLSNEWQVFWLTPFKETIKLESDIIFTTSIWHWWNIFRLRDVVLSVGCKNFMQQQATRRDYRRLFDDNQLPDVYSGLMYFRYSQTAMQFFTIAKQIFNNWTEVAKTLKKCNDKNPTTDVVYALASKILGLELTTIPTVDFINFVHMKNAINEWSEAVDWNEAVVVETDLPIVRVNNINQYHPFHYQNKKWVTQEIVEQYEQRFFS